MTSRLVRTVRQIARRIWFRAGAFCVLAVVTAFLGIWLSPYIPDDVPAQIGSDAVDNILGILASSMLTVTTFSLSTMVSAYASTTSNVTPRATKLIMEDTVTQNVLSTFIGSFLFSLVGIIVLSTGLYGSSGRVVLFAVTILVILFIVVTLLRWIDHLSRLGRVTETTQRVEAVTLEALEERRREPCLGGVPLLDAARAIPASARPVRSRRIGYVQHVDTGALSALAREGKGRVFVVAIPGDFVDTREPIAFLDGVEEGEEAARACFTVSDTRSFDQDPRYGGIVLAEIASRALSPATNDLGTAIGVIGRAVRLLAAWAETADTPAEPAYPHVHVPPLALGDLFDDFFTPLARDGAAIVEVGVRLQKGLRTLARLGRDDFAAEALRHSRQALERFESGLTIEDDKRRVRALAQEIEAIVAGRGAAG
ncbi:DUF2254 domain-containing protein [Aurantimonas sp. Leaf443]|uniref:DUF2254 domain-containing protein n=1 Tax=Aurantimonas sp. Leaf443 TaxID=1736378 RepID=UPI0006F3F598|nr:DUF2254 domain-containing protein [Aurantimonas sp. Leaf443]KQT83175.1 hypothetical protein ASG48_14515 [Aurantimonas sp. Leaf443]